MIILEPLGGLANRMRVLASALTASKESNNKLVVVWNLNTELNCDFDTIFESIPGVKFRENNANYKLLHRSNQANYYKRIKAKVRNKILGIDYCVTEGDVKDKDFNKKIVQIITKNRNVHIATNHEFGSGKKDYKVFSPKKEIQKIIDNLTIRFTNRTIGLHIRQTDNKIAIDNSPIELFKDKINEELAKNSETLFFLATDSLSIQEELISKFGDKIIVYPKEWTRNSKQGIIDAVVDMYCLSKTKLIYASYWTSFSDVAALIGGIQKIELVGNQDFEIK